MYSWRVGITGYVLVGGVGITGYVLVWGVGITGYVLVGVGIAGYV